ncbi:integrin alpha-PS2 [Tetranychus urticae]|nr:integrin alpha-PS2 [Tetranychus urticae]
MWIKLNYGLFVYLIAILINYCWAFNIDLRTAVVHRGTPDTYYGFAVAQHKDGDNYWLLVGAPLAPGSQEGISRGGAVFKCLPQSSGLCQVIPFDTTGNRNITTKNGLRAQTEEKEGQWFGATVQSSGKTGVIVACAPRYSFFSYNNKRRDPVGFCYVSTGGFAGITPLAPCRVAEKWGYHRLGSCQAGFSASVEPEGRQVFLGAVGSYYWQGKVFSYDLHQLTQPPYETKEGKESNDDTYLGYSLVWGKFGSSDRSNDIAVGQPRGANLTGQVCIFSKEMKNIVNITGDTMGAYFGYSLASADLNRDGLDDLIIGAPFYTKPDSKDKSYEHGRVYIAYQRKPGHFEIGDKIDGHNHRGRFGNAVTSLGDVNMDGFPDIAIGAPYGGEGERGAVYIYNGNKHGINKNYSQVINGLDLNDPGIKTFGFSLSGGLDMDENAYPDLLVGAYASDRAVHLRSRPVVNVNTTMKINPPKISLKDRSCSLNDGSRVTCMDIEFCLSYDGVRLPDVMDLSTFIRLDYQPNRPPRAFFLNNPNESEQEISQSYQRRRERCNKFKIYIANNIRDKLTPIKIEAEHNIPNHPSHPNSSKGSPRPVLSLVSSNKLIRNIIILKNCSVDEICIPDLKITAESNPHDSYPIGTGKAIELNVTIVNKREDAFESTFELEIPIDVEYSHTEGIKGCFPPKPKLTGKNVLKCDIGNPLLAKDKLNFSVHLKPKLFVTASPTFLFLMSVNSTNPEKNETLGDNQVQLSIPVRVDINMTSTGASSPEQIIHNVSETIVHDQTTAEDFGYLVNHIYTLQNIGPSSVKLARVTILWPTKTLDGKHLLYLLSDPEIDITRGTDAQPVTVDCNKLGPDVIDPLKLPKHRNLETRKYSNYLGDDPRTISHLNHENTSLISRVKRYSTSEDISKNYGSLAEALSCGATQCTKIVCHVHNLGRQSITYTIRSRLSKKTISEIGLPEFQVSSKLVAEIVQLPYGIENTQIEMDAKVTRVSTDVRVIGLERGLPIPLWIILLAILVGLLLLFILAMCLWKLGFFKRKRPPTREEDYEPLQPNGNGYKFRTGDTSL